MKFYVKIFMIRNDMSYLWQLKYGFDSYLGLVNDLIDHLNCNVLKNGYGIYGIWYKKMYRYPFFNITIYHSFYSCYD